MIGSALWALYETVAMIVGLSSLCLLCLLGLPVSFLLACLPKTVRTRMGRKVIARGFAAYLNLLRLLGLKIDCTALDVLRDRGPFIIVANHPSLLDAVIILSRLPNACCVMKAALGNNLLFGPVARASGYIRNNDPMKLVKMAEEELASNHHLLIFPEGTRTVAQGVNVFGKTAALIAARSGMPVQTVFIQMNSLYLGKRWPLFKRPNFPLTIQVTLGEQFTVPAQSTAHSSKLTERLEDYYQRHLRPSAQDNWADKPVADHARKAAPDI
jgi:1-acyl-sn-glycerol-3-phosphate acyltransferase